MIQGCLNHTVDKGAIILTTTAAVFPQNAWIGKFAGYRTEEKSREVLNIRKQVPSLAAQSSLGKMARL